MLSLENRIKTETKSSSFLLKTKTIQTFLSSYLLFHGAVHSFDGYFPYFLEGWLQYYKTGSVRTLNNSDYILYMLP